MGIERKRTKRYLDRGHNLGVSLLDQREECRVTFSQNLWVLCESDKDRADSRREGTVSQRVTDREPNEESVTHRDRFQVGVVRDERGVEDFEVDEGEGGTEGSDGVGTEGPDVVDETVVDQGRDSTILEQVPGVLGGVDVALSVKSDFDVSVSVEPRISTSVSCSLWT